MKILRLSNNALHGGPWSSSRMTSSSSVSRRNLPSMALWGMSKHPGHKYVSMIPLLVLLTLVRYHSFSLGHSTCTNPRVRHCSGSKSTFAIFLRRVKVLSWLRFLIPTKKPYAAAYVALSRATSLDSLEVHNFDPLKQGFPLFSSKPFLIVFPRVMAHPRVIEWYEGLSKGPREERTDSDEYDQYLTDEAYGYPSSKWPKSLSD
ncbi:hypothetical protein EDB83DRAFT_592473 [Lactarius deliciosus]|nr:hypothetical protein EDB83DRAFT_592473 [Lactarius deliciosus]